MDRQYKEELIMTESFNIPAGAQSFAPGAIMSEKQVIDASRVIPGLVTNAAPADNAVKGPEVGKTIDLSGDKQEPTDQPSTETSKNCPACGVTLNDPYELKPTEEEKDMWLRHILGEPRFIRTFTLFSGKVAVSFRSRTSTENDVIYNQLTNEVKDGLITEFGGIMSPAYYARMNRLMMMYSLKSVELRDKSEPRITDYPEITDKAYPKTDDKDERPLVVRAEAKLFGNSMFSEGLLSAISTAHRRFESLIAVLIRHSDDPDFWNPAGIDT